MIRNILARTGSSARFTLCAAVTVASVLSACSSSSDSGAEGAPGARCAGPSDCQAFSCTCPSGAKLENARVCENKACASPERSCSASCDATRNDKVPRTPTGAGRAVVCDESLTAFKGCPPSPSEIDACRTQVADKNCGKTAETYYACANNHASCLAGAHVDGCSNEKSEIQSCLLAF